MAVSKSVRALFAMISIFLISGSGAPESARAENQSRCDDLIDQELKRLVDQDYQGILSQQLQLTTMKLALEAKRAKESKSIDVPTVEAYLKNEFTRLGSLDKDGVREKLAALYTQNQLPIDIKTLNQRIQSANYFKRPLRFKNEELSVYVLAHQELVGKKSIYNRMDSAILWYQSELAAKSTAKPGTAESNLLQASTLAGIYSGVMSGVKKWTSAELENRITYLKTAISNSFESLSKVLVTRVDPKCKTEMPCFNCATKPESLEDRLAGFMQHTKRLLDFATASPSPSAEPSASPIPSASPVATATPVGNAIKNPIDVQGSSETVIWKNTDPDHVVIKIELEKPIVTKPVEENLNNVQVTNVAPAKTQEKVPEATPTPTGTPTPTPTVVNNAPNAKDLNISDLYNIASAQAMKEGPLKRELFEKAYKGWSKIKKTKGCGNRVMVVDFDQKSTAPRAYLIDMTTGELVLQANTSHAINSDANDDGIPDTFGNGSNSQLSSVGFFKIKNRDFNSPSWGKYGPAFALEGIDGDLNSKADVGHRAILLHGYPHAMGFKSYGCFVFDSEDSLAFQYGQKYPQYSTRKKPILREIYDNMQNGDLIFAYSSRSDQDAKSQWLK